MHNMKKKLISLIIFNLVSTPIYAEIQTRSDADSANAKEIDDVITVTATRTKQSITQVNNAISVINSSTIQTVDANHIQQVLNRVAGVNFQRNNGQEYLPAVRSPVLTGAGSCGSFLMLENGIPLRPNGLCNVNELFEAHSEQAQQIEILRGPATAHYGSNGLHGVVNIVEPASFYASNTLKVSLGENDYAQLGVNASSENFAVSTTIKHDGGFRDDSEFDQQKLSLQHKTSLNNSVFNNVHLNTYFTAFNLDQDTAGYLTGKDSYKSETLSKTNPNPEAYRKAKGLRVHQVYQFDSGATFKPYFRSSNMEFLQHFLPGKPTEESKQTSAGFQYQTRTDISDTVTMSYGLDTEVAKIDLLQYQNSPTQGSAFLQATIPSGKHYDFSVNTLTAAPFVQFDAQLTTKLRLIAGARAEYTRFDYTNNMNAGRVDENGNTCGFGGCRYTRPASSDDNFTVVSPKLGAIYQINSQQSAFINISHGYRMPQVSELYRLQREQEVADLSPEKIKGIEASWKYINDAFKVEANAYYFDKKNVIVRNSDFFNINGGETSHKGLELAVSDKLTESITLLVNGTYNIHQYKNNPNISAKNIVGNDVDTAPRKLANAFITYNHNDFTAEIHGQYTSKYFLDVENEHEYQGHFLMHARAAYNIGTSLSVALNILNLTDKRYAERADYTLFTNERYFPGQDRNIKASLTYQF